MKKKFSIVDYSVFAASLIVETSAVHSEIVYNDIDDVMLDNNFENYLIDLNDDDIDDFEFTKFSGSYLFFTSSGFTQLRNFDWIAIDPKNGVGSDGNQIAGKSSSTYFSYLIYWPYAISNNSLIDSDLNFNGNEGVQLLASRVDLLPGGAVIDNDGYWYPEIEDRFIGLHFLDFDSNYHYGWIRCSVLDSGEILVIKDFAFETQINHPISAGDTISYVSIDENDLNNVESVYSYGSKVYLKMKDVSEFPKIVIQDINGAAIFSETIKSDFLEIDLKGFPINYYFVSIYGNGWYYHKQVLIKAN